MPSIEDVNNNMKKAIDKASPEDSDTWDQSPTPVIRYKVGRDEFSMGPRLDDYDEDDIAEEFKRRFPAKAKFLELIEQLGQAFRADAEETVECTCCSIHIPSGYCPCGPLS